MKNLIVSLVASLLVFCTPAFAQDFPTRGLNYNIKEKSSISYDCKKIDSGLLSCEFVQTSVRKKAKADGLEDTLKKANENFERLSKGEFDEKIQKDNCDMFNDLTAVVSGKRTAEEVARDAQYDLNRSDFVESMNSKTSQEKEDMRKIFAPLADFCRTKSRGSFIESAKMSHLQEMRTCTVSSYKFTQTFKWVGDFNNSKGAWVVDSSPSGECGVVELSRFESEKSGIGDFLLWKYIARKAITNPNGGIAQFKCNKFDEAEYVYDWKDHNKGRQNCDYLEFSVF